MDPSATLNRRAKERDTNFPISSRRTSSFSSQSSSSSVGSSSYFSDYSPLSPAIPLRFSGVPFSWEHFPGIPKDKLQNCHKKKESMNLLPLPPSATRTISRNQNSDAIGFRRNRFSGKSFRKDPFFEAFVKCSKGGDGDRESRSSIGDRLGSVNLQVSCKKTCAVSDSIVYLPRPSRRTYGLITHHRSP